MLVLWLSGSCSYDRVAPRTRRSKKCRSLITKQQVATNMKTNFSQNPEVSPTWPTLEPHSAKLLEPLWSGHWKIDHTPSVFHVFAKAWQVRSVKLHLVLGSTKTITFFPSVVSRTCWTLSSPVSLPAYRYAYVLAQRGACVLASFRSASDWFPQPSLIRQQELEINIWNREATMIFPVSGTWGASQLLSW